MAMSLKKITAIAVGGAMVASTLASGVAAATVTVGDIEGFMKNVVKDGEPNVEIVVGSKAAAMDVVSAADIAAKIGSMCYKEATIEDGSAELRISVSADTDVTNNLLRSPYNTPGYRFLLFTTPKRKYTNADWGNNVTLYRLVGGVSINETISFPRLSTLLRDTDADPDDLTREDSADTIEFLLALVESEEGNRFRINKDGLVYGTLRFDDGGDHLGDLRPLHIGMEIPLVGEIYRIADTDDNIIYLGKEAYSGTLREGEVVDIGNGYQVKVKSVLERLEGQRGNPEVTVEIYKDGKLVATESDETTFEFVYKDIGVIVHDAYRDVSRNYGYASLIIIKDVKGYELGKEFVKDWKIYAICRDDTGFYLEDDDFTEDGIYLNISQNRVYGLALRYEGSDIKNLEEGDKVPFANDYVVLEFTDEDERNRLYAKYKMEISKDLTLGIMDKVEILNAVLKLKDIKAVSQEVVPIKTPIAKLDTEASLDTDKYLILVGGPVANKLSEELQNKGKININNDSPATLQVVDGRILVVAGGDRHRTREAALYLIENY